MAREKKNKPGAASGDHAKERHKRDRKGNLHDWTAPLPPGLVARPDRPRVSSKHKSWYEFVENKDKKKKLEFEFIETKEPPPGFEFVPIGNPALTTACKELSREQGALIFIVTSSIGQFSEKLSRHLNRTGHHFRQTIVDQARASLGDDDRLVVNGPEPGQPEPIPERQEDINKQADAAIRDLFPRIPNTDRQMIIEHAFNKSKLNKGEPPVGLAAHVTLSRRTQLAVLAHIRHTHTRYDQLLRETTYVNARKTVESLCLDILVKWRGDEETGRDQLDEILCEVIVISDSDNDESDDDDVGYESSSTSSADEIPARDTVREGVQRRAPQPPAISPSVSQAPDNSRGEVLPRATHAPQKVKKTSRRDMRAAKWAQRGFGRYQAARDQAWHQAVERQRRGDGETAHSAASMAADRFVSHGPQPWGTGEPGRPKPGPALVRSPVKPPCHERHRSYGTSLPSVNVHYEREGRIDALQQTTFPANSQVPQESRVQGNPPSNGFRPIVGSRPVPNGAADVERVRYRGQDLKDYLVESIEPASESSNLPPRFPVSLRQPKPGRAHGVEGPLRTATHPRNPTALDMAAAQRFHAACTEEGFVRLPPRPDPTRMYNAPGARSDPFVLANSHPVSAARTSDLAATSGGSSLRHSTTYHDNAALRDGGPIVQPGPRPVWIGEDGVVLRSETRPILIHDYPASFRQPETNSGYVPLENRRPSPIKRTTDARYAGPRRADEHDRRPIDQRMETLRGEFVEIVRVSNRFPRQHEPRSAPPGFGGYGLRSSAPQHRASPHLNEGVTRHALRQLPAHGQRMEWPVDTARQPELGQGNAPFVVRHPDGPGEFQRQERVVGIEYIQTRPSFEGHTYSDRGPVYDLGEPVYRPRSRSVIPVPYTGQAHQSHPGRTIPKRDEVIMLD